VISRRKLDIALGAKGIEGYGGGGGAGRGDQDVEFEDQPGIHNEWRSRLDGPNGLLLLLVSMFFFIRSWDMGVAGGAQHLYPIPNCPSRRGWASRHLEPAAVPPPPVWGRYTHSAVREGIPGF